MKGQNREKEIKERSLLYHRFGILHKNTQMGDETVSIENLDFKNTLAVFKGSFRNFILVQDSQNKINHLITKVLNKKHYRISEKEILLLENSISHVILNFYNEGYLDNIDELLLSHALIIVPIKTIYFDEGVEKEHIKAIALFNDRIIKVNRGSVYKTPGIGIYRFQHYPIQELKTILQSYLQSFTTPLELENWDKSINSATLKEKIKQITKKEQSVGNAAWLTLKMLIIVIVYAAFYEYFKAKGLKEFESDSLAMEIAEGYYKLFIVDDRNRSIRDYLALHDYETREPLSVLERVQSIKTFLSERHDKRNPADIAMLEIIYLKSLNWLLADYLKSGDIGEAHALIVSEAGNLNWNPLIYAAKNGKIVIAEMLGSNEHFVNMPDANLNYPLHHAASNGHFDIIQVLLRYIKKNKINILAKNIDGNTALHLAILNNHSDVLELLLKYEPTLLNLQNEQGQTPLKIACDYHHTSIIKRLLLHGATLEGIDVGQYSEEVQNQLQKAGKPYLK